MAFSPDSFVEKLKKLTQSQQSIQTLSEWALFHKDASAEIIRLWNEAVQKETKADRLLTLFYLANDIVQRSKRKSVNFITEFTETLRSAVPDIYRAGDSKMQKNIIRTIQLWREREIYSSDFVSNLVDFLESGGIKSGVSEASKDSSKRERDRTVAETKSDSKQDSAAPSSKRIRVSSPRNEASSQPDTDSVVSEPPHNSHHHHHTHRHSHRSSETATDPATGAIVPVSASTSPSDTTASPRRELSSSGAFRIPKHHSDAGLGLEASQTSDEDGARDRDLARSMSTDSDNERSRSSSVERSELFSPPKPLAMQVTHPVARSLLQLEKATEMDSILEAKVAAFPPEMLQSLISIPAASRSSQQKKQLADGLELFLQYRRRLATQIKRRKEALDLLRNESITQENAVKKATNTVASLDKSLSMLSSAVKGTSASPLLSPLSSPVGASLMGASLSNLLGSASVGSRGIQSPLQLSPIDSDAFSDDEVMPPPGAPPVPVPTPISPSRERYSGGSHGHNGRAASPPPPLSSAPARLGLHVQIEHTQPSSSPPQHPVQSTGFALPTSPRLPQSTFPSLGASIAATSSPVASSSSQGSAASSASTLSSTAGAHAMPFIDPNPVPAHPNFSSPPSPPPLPVRPPPPAPLDLHHLHHHSHPHMLSPHASSSPLTHHHPHHRSPSPNAVLRVHPAPLVTVTSTGETRVVSPPLPPQATAEWIDIPKGAVQSPMSPRAIIPPGSSTTVPTFALGAAGSVPPASSPHAPANQLSSPHHLTSQPLAVPGQYFVVPQAHPTPFHVHGTSSPSTSDSAPSLSNSSSPRVQGGSHHASGQLWGQPSS